MAYLYRHIRLDKNEPFYIGIGSDSMGEYTRSKSKESRSRYWHNIVGKTEYRIDIVCDELSYEEAIAKEIEFISIYGRISNGGILCNLTDGGEGTVGVIYSEETKKKMSLAKKGVMPKHLIGLSTGRKLTAEHKEKIRLSVIGRKYSDESKLKMSNSAKNKTWTQEHKDNCIRSLKKYYEENERPEITRETRIKMGLSQRGKKLSDETKLKISKAQIGRKITPEQREKLRIASTGRKHSPESIAKMKFIHKNLPRKEEDRLRLNRLRLSMTKEEYNKLYKIRAVACYCAKTGNWLANYSSQKEARMALGISSGGISNILSGKITNPKKYNFKFIDQDA
jgi:hypothetical protein